MKNGGGHIDLKFRKGCLLLLAGIMILSSCDKGFEELNINPNQPTLSDPDFLFTESLVKGAGQFGSGIHTEIWTLMVWTMQMADINGIPQAGNEYAYSGTYADEQWREWYSGVLSNLEEIIKLTKGDPFMVNKHALARIWRAYIFHRITDLWGDIPYFQAVKGLDPEEDILTPVYDPQKDIYTDLIKELKEAVASIDPSQDNYGSADVLYNGNLDHWKKFGNSLRLRLAIRISDIAPATTQSVLAELRTADNFISSNEEGAHFIFNTGDVRHPFYELEVSGQGMRNPSQFLVDLLEAGNDPRLPFMAEQTPQSVIFGTPDYVGIPNLTLAADMDGLNSFNTSAVGSWFLEDSITNSMALKGTILSYAETCFLLAEASQKGWDMGQSAEYFYEAGVRSNMESYGIPDTAIDTYLQNAGKYDHTQEQIITQKWLTFIYRDGYESYAEIRRTGYPALKDRNNNPIDWNSFPNRLAYPPSEVSLNGSNVTAVGEGINETHSRVWWDPN